MRASVIADAAHRGACHSSSHAFERAGRTVCAVGPGGDPGVLCARSDLATLVAKFLPGTRGPWGRADRIAMSVSLIISLAFVLPVLYHGWVPFDEGWIMEQALRVLDGQLPHRDFDDLWTGGWSFAHAGIFAAVGHSMAHMRTAILGAWLVGLVLLYQLSRRWVEPVVGPPPV